MPRRKYTVVHALIVILNFQFLALGTEALAQARRPMPYVAGARAQKPPKKQSDEWDKFLSRARQRRPDAQKARELADEAAFKQLLEMRRHPEKVKIIDAQMFKIAFPMIASEMFWALQSGDSKIVKEFLQSLTTVDFWLNMQVFSVGMRGWQEAMLAFTGNDELKAQSFMHAALPFGDLVAAYFGDVYNNPSLKCVMKTYSPDDKFKDPDTGVEDNSFASRLKKRQQCEDHLLHDIWKSLSNPESNVGKWFHAVDLGLIQIGTNKASQQVLGFIERKIKTNVAEASADYNNMIFDQMSKKIGTSQMMMSDAEFDLWAARGAGGFAIDKEAAAVLSARVVKSVRVAELWEWLTETSMVARGAAVFGVTPPTIAMFVVTEGVTRLVMPTITNTFRVHDVHATEDEFQKAVNWYLTTNDELPWSQFKQDSKPWHWLKFFNEGGNFNDDEFKKATWHAQDWGNLSNEAFDFMAKFSEKYLGKYADDVSWWNCKTKAQYIVEPFRWMTWGHPWNTECKQAWVTKNTPQFVDEIRNFHGSQIIRARLDKVDEAYNRYRNETLLADLYKTWSRWTKDVAERDEQQMKKERYYIWIARGMDRNDWYFIENKGLWHRATDDTHAFKEEEVDRVAEFDVEVLGFRYTRDIDPCGQREHPNNCVDQELTVNDHKYYLPQFIRDNRGLLDRSWLVMPIMYHYPDSFGDYTDSNPEETTRVRSKYIATAAQQGDAERVNQITLGHVARWLIAGMGNTTDFKVNEGHWHPVNMSQGDFENFVSKEVFDLLVDPILAVRSFADRKAMIDEIEAAEKATRAPRVPSDIVRLQNDALTLLQGGKQVSEQFRDEMTVLSKTYGWIYMSRKKLTEDLRKLNEEYTGHIAFENNRGAARNQYGISKWYKKITGSDLFDGSATVFERGGYDDDHFLGGGKLDSCGGDFHCAGILRDEVNPMSLPKGVLNLFNWQTNRVLKILDNVLPKVKISDKLNDADWSSYSLDRELMLTMLIEAGIASDKNADQNMALRNAASQVFQNNALIELVSKDDKLKDRCAVVAKRLANSTKWLWPNLMTSVNQSSPEEMFAQLTGQRNDQLAVLKSQVKKISKMIDDRGVSPATVELEAALYGEVRNEVFGIPLMAASIGGRNRMLELVNVLGSEIVNIQNQKVIHGRLGCFAIHDTLCTQTGM